jgi:class 3 adenylate cyclase
MYEDRLEGQARLFSLTDELRRLQSKDEQREQKTKRDDALLKAILPQSVYAEFQRNGNYEANYYEDLVLYYSDFAGFTKIASGMPPNQLMDLLGELFDGFDSIMSRHGCERVEAIGDAYLAVSGTSGEGDPVTNMARAALEIREFLRDRNALFHSLGVPKFLARIGLHRGSVIGGLVGRSRVRFAIFGDAVNIAQRIESGGMPDQVTVSAAVAEGLQSHDAFQIRKRDPIDAKGKGFIPVWTIDFKEGVTP